MSSVPHNLSALEPVVCPTEEEIACFIDGRASPGAVECLLLHLDRCAACRQLVANTLSAVEPSREGLATGGIPRTFTIGEVVNGRYRIDRFLSQGGMGEVYEAWDLQLSESIALKTVACTGLDNARLCNRMRAEVQLARRVTHPNVCRILEFGLKQQVVRDAVERVPFFTMEYLKGETLASYASRCGKLPEGEILELAAQILAGLSAIHAAGIIHRDLKPENVFLLEPTSGPRRVVVMDFGLARPLDRESAFVSSQDASTPGTPAYMAPEQALGKPATIESDIYAFGVILYRLVTGQLPFKGNTSVALAVARLQDSAPPVARAAPGVSSQLGSIVDRCLERDPRRRYVAVSEIQRAFDWSRAPAQPKRRRVSTVLYLCASVALVASLFAIQRARSGNSVSPATPQRAAVPQKIRDTPATVARAAAPITAVAPPGSVAVAGEARVASSRHWVRQRPAPSPPAASSSAMKALTHDVPEAAASTSLPVTPNDDDILIPSFAGTPPPSPNAGGP